MNITKSQAKNDCGVCALATALQLDWEQAARLIWSEDQLKRRRAFNTKTKHLANAAVSFGAHVLLDSASKLIRVPNLVGRRMWTDIEVHEHELAIVKVKPAFIPGGNWHWVVWDGQKVLDNDGKTYRPIDYHEPKSYMILRRP